MAQPRFFPSGSLDLWAGFDTERVRAIVAGQLGAALDLLRARGLARPSDWKH